MKKIKTLEFGFMNSILVVNLENLRILHKCDNSKYCT